MSVKNLLNYNFHLVKSLYRISHVIGYDGPLQLLNKEQHLIISYLIPYIVKKPKVISLLENIVERVDREKEVLLKKYFPVSIYIFFFIFDIVFVI